MSALLLCFWSAVAILMFSLIINVSEVAVAPADVSVIVVVVVVVV